MYRVSHWLRNGKTSAEGREHIQPLFLKTSDPLSSGSRTKRTIAHSLRRRCCKKNRTRLLINRTILVISRKRAPQADFFYFDSQKKRRAKNSGRRQKNAGQKESEKRFLKPRRTYKNLNNALKSPAGTNKFWSTLKKAPLGRKKLLNIFKKPRGADEFWKAPEKAPQGITKSENILYKKAQGRQTNEKHFFSVQLKRTPALQLKGSHP